MNNTATLVYFELRRKEKSISTKEACKIYRTLYGYNNSSCYGRYHTRVDGLLDRVGGLRVAKSLFLIRNEDSEEVLNFLLDSKAIVKTWQVITSDEEAEALSL
jgi:hypothetical protein